ncbi:MAG: hypothetical protein NC102_04100 [Clostridium sp.]|nr:hypothetical protein [Clostridium sp.]
MVDNIKTVGMHPGASATEPNPQTAGTHSAASDVETNLPTRKNIRAPFHNYSGGDYFVTICTRDKTHYFGEIRNNIMHLSPIGIFANEALKTLPSHYPYIEVPLFIVMPNHIHAIISICQPTDAPGCIPTIRPALGVVIGGFKQSVTMHARRNDIDFGWQKRFHDHIIRNVHDGNHIAEYIETNVAKWSTDCFNLK